MIEQSQAPSEDLRRLKHRLLCTALSPLTIESH